MLLAEHLTTYMICELLFRRESQRLKLRIISCRFSEDIVEFSVSFRKKLFFTRPHYDKIDLSEYLLYSRSREEVMSLRFYSVTGIIMYKYIRDHIHSEKY